MELSAECRIAAMDFENAEVGFHGFLQVAVERGSVELQCVRHLSCMALEPLGNFIDVLTGVFFLVHGLCFFFVIRGGRFCLPLVQFSPYVGAFMHPMWLNMRALRPASAFSLQIYNFFGASVAVLFVFDGSETIRICKKDVLKNAFSDILFAV